MNLSPSQRWWLVALLVSAAISVAWFDVRLATWINSISTPEMRTAGYWLEEAGKSHWILVYSLLMILATWRSWRSIARKHLVLFGSIAASGLLANVFKVLVCRPRPPLFLAEGLLSPQWFGFVTDWSWNSFPSGHATTGIAIAIAGSATWPRLRPLAWIVGLAIALGRVMYNVHYLSDVLTGMALGAAISWWMIRYESSSSSSGASSGAS
ncbi:MAG: phosphatase PAP2 family protein [Candidatus Kapaibacteriota bacterium]